ncbi:hypothetical protein F2Q68_00029658 [Brassica cretica]|uniref:Uncharacterized protein n=1 Tax=Brassica cretica TaxID=69181 RepID=A0A8S9GBD4_BRACR|nr:hypothetical protein F2Q68_00029658 [Brassica cretica]
MKLLSFSSAMFQTPSSSNSISEVDGFSTDNHKDVLRGIAAALRELKVCMAPEVARGEEQSPLSELNEMMIGSSLLLELNERGRVVPSAGFRDVAFH